MQINIEGDSAPIQESFFFEPAPNKLLQDKELKQVLIKWGLQDTLKMGSYRFNQHFQTYDTQRLLKDLFSSPNIRYINSNIKYPSGAITSVEYEKLNCNELSLQMFDNLEKQGLVKSDYIQKCMSEYFEGIQICDKVRQCLLLDESENFCVYNEQQRKQFLFKVFQFLVIGGSLNQYEDKLSPYLEWTKKVYKALVSVRKKVETSQIFVESLALKIKSFDSGKIKIEDFNPQNFVFVVINPSIRAVHVVSNEWVKFW